MAVVCAIATVGGPPDMITRYTTRQTEPERGDGMEGRCGIT